VSKMKQEPLKVKPDIRKRAVDIYFSKVNYNSRYDFIMKLTNTNEDQKESFLRKKLNDCSLLEIEEKQHSLEIENSKGCCDGYMPEIIIYPSKWLYNAGVGRC